MSFDNPEGIMQELDVLIRKLSEQNVEFAKLLRNRAETKEHYDKTLAKTLITLQNEGVQVTILSKRARGVEEVSRAEFEKIMAKGLLENCRNIMRGISTAIDVKRSQLTWLRNEKGNG